MATVLDIGLFQYFNAIFPTLFVFIIVYALLQKLELLSSEKPINFAIAAAAAFMVLLFQDVLDIINFMTPWFVVVAIFILLFILLLRVAGATPTSITEFVTGKEVVGWALLGIVALIFMAAIGHVYGQRWLPYTHPDAESELPDGQVVAPGNGTAQVATGNWQTNLFESIFHPKVLGLLLIFAIATASVALLGSRTT